MTGHARRGRSVRTDPHAEPPWRRQDGVLKQVAVNFERVREMRDGLLPIEFPGKSLK